MGRRPGIVQNLQSPPELHLRFVEVMSVMGELELFVWRTYS